MLKNNKGVTLVALIVTIIVAVILAGISITTSDMLIKDTKKKRIITNMYLVRSEVEAIYDEYQFSEDVNVLKGELVTNSLTGYGVTTAEGDLWYTWNKTVLSNLGFDEEMLSGSATYIVNYTTGEIIYTNGVEAEDGTINYTLTDMVNNAVLN